MLSISRFPTAILVQQPLQPFGVKRRHTLSERELLPQNTDSSGAKFGRYCRHFVLAWTICAPASAIFVRRAGIYSNSEPPSFAFSSLVYAVLQNTLAHPVCVANSSLMGSQ